MKIATVVLAMALLAPPLLPGAALGQAISKKEEALAKIAALLDHGELDKAKHAIDHLLEHNPGDADLLRLKDEWRIRKSGAGALLSGKGDLRETCWRIVEATLRGNPEEWPPLLSIPDRDRVRALLEGRRTGGAEEDRRIAAALLAELSREASRPAARTVEELVAAIREGPEECRSALAEAERRGVKEVLPLARQVFAKARSADLRCGAAGLLLALGDESPRAWLRETLRAERPAHAVSAMQVLLRHPGKGVKPVRALYDSVAGDDEILRVKPTLLSLALEALGESSEKGAREFLETLLASPEHRVDAARALGAVGDPRSKPALRAYLLDAPEREETPTVGGLGYLGKASGLSEAGESEELRPLLVGAIAILRLKD